MVAREHDELLERRCIRIDCIFYAVTDGCESRGEVMCISSFGRVRMRIYLDICVARVLVVFEVKVPRDHPLEWVTHDAEFDIPRENLVGYGLYNVGDPCMLGALFRGINRDRFDEVRIVVGEDLLDRVSTRSLNVDEDRLVFVGDEQERFLIRQSLVQMNLIVPRRPRDVVASAGRQ